MAKLSRRSVLLLLGGGAAALAVGGRALMPALPPRGLPQTQEVLAWVIVGMDNRLRLILPRQEMGQGIGIGLRQILADAAEVPLDATETVYHDTDAIPTVRATVGSESIQDFAEPLALAGRALRSSLRARAVARVGPVDDTPEGFRAGDGRALRFADLLDEGASVIDPAQLDLDHAPPPRRHVGQSHPTDKIRAIVTGQPLFAADMALPEMLCAAMARPPRNGARLRSVDDQKARAVAGYAGLVQDGEAAAVLARDPASAWAARDALTLEWQGGATLGQAEWDALLDIDGWEERDALQHHLHDQGGLDAAKGWTVDLRFDIPMAAHGAIEPRAALARWSADQTRLEVWTGTQDAFFTRSLLARRFGLSESAVTVHSARVGGGFGGRAIPTVEIEAAWAARLAGRPVKMHWSRPEEFRQGYHRPPSSHRVRARLDADGRIAAWDHGFASGHVIFSSAAMPPWLQAATSLVADMGVGRNALPPYDLPNARVRMSDVRLPHPTGPWRGLGAGPNMFVIESAMDELALASGQDPLAFRLRHLADRPRLAECFRRAVAMPPPMAAGRARGLAGGIYKDQSYAATVAEVARDAQGGVTVTGLWAAHDCGPIVNPDQVRAQTEGNLIWALGMVFTDGLTVEEGQVTADYFTASPIPRYRQIPPIAVELIESAGPTMTGAGETAIVCAAAVANAVRRLTGRRAARLPLKEEDLI